MSLPYRDLPVVFTTHDGNSWTRSRLMEPGFLDRLSRDNIKAIARFLREHWGAEEINKTWLGQIATKGQMIEFISTGYVKTPVANEPVAVQDIPVAVNPYPEPVRPPDSLADAIAAAIQGRIKTEASVSAEQVSSLVEERLESLTELVQSEDARIANQAQEALFSERERVNGVLATFSTTLTELTAKVGESVSKTIRIEVAERVSYTLDGLRHQSFDDLFLDIVAMIETGNTERANFWLIGPAGSGKTTAAKKIAEKLGLPFYFNGAIDSEYKLRGFIDAQGRIVYTPFRRAFEFGGVYLFDECDASMPAACLAFNSALANGSYDFPLDSSNQEQLPITRHRTNIILAGANTWNGPEGGFVGRMRQDSAFLDRFMRIPWPVDENLERKLCANMEWVDYCQAVRKRIVASGVEHIVSPRCTFNGDALLAAGRPWKRAVETCLRKGLDIADWNKISGEAN